MTIRAFAELCGVSPASVSRFFSGQGMLSEDIRVKIEQMVKKTGYRPPTGYRGRRKINETIAVLVPNMKQTFFDDILEELRQRVQEQHKRMVVLLMDEETPENTLSLIQSYKPMGVILLNESTKDPIADELSRLGVPTVVCGALAMGRRFSSVHIDDMMATFDGMNYLIELGHQNIGLLADNSTAISSGFQRVTGCKKAMEDAKLPFPDSWIVHGGMTFQAGYEGMRTLSHRAPELTAVFAFSDDVAAGAIACLKDAGKRVPEDLSVLGFDDNSRAKQVRPLLTTVHQSITQLAQKSIEHLLTMENAGEITSLTLSYQIIERDSCRRLV